MARESVPWCVLQHLKGHLPLWSLLGGDLPELDVLGPVDAGSANDPYITIIIMCIYSFLCNVFFILLFMLLFRKRYKGSPKTNHGLSAPKMDHQQPRPARFQWATSSIQSPNSNCIVLACNYMFLTSSEHVYISIYIYYTVYIYIYIYNYN